MRQDPAFSKTLETWQPVIGKAILEAWGLPRRICDAVENQDYLLEGGSADLEPLTRLLSAAKLRHRLEVEPELRLQHRHPLVPLHPQHPVRWHLLRQSWAPWQHGFATTTLQHSLKPSQSRPPKCEAFSRGHSYGHRVERKP